MAAKDDKTEKASPKRKREARKKGQVAKSPDLNGAVVLIAGLIMIVFMGPKIVDSTAGYMRNAFQDIPNAHAVTTAAGLSGLYHALISTLLATVAPIAGLCLVAALLVNVAQVGFRPSLSGLKPDVKRINPVSGFKNIFSARIAFETGKALAKVAVMGAVAAMALVPQITNLGASVGTTPFALGALMSHSVTDMAERAAIAYLLIGIIDFIHQRRKHVKMLKMTKQEAKDEHKQTQLPAEVKGALRRRQLMASRARMMAAIPHADVVVTNPTHFAVVLKYDGVLPAPVVVAKGQDLVAAQIRRIAEDNDVPIVPDPPLARELHRDVEIGQMIPAEMYAAVAQVLAFVYRLANKRKVAS
jgi:flagellar biosynthesis protein FlhB